MLQYLLRRFVTGLAALTLALCLAALVGVEASANSVNIFDNAHVLNAGQVSSAASQLSNPISIYTINTFTGGATALEQQARTHLTSQNQLVMAIDTANKHIVIVGGSGVRLSQSQYNSVTQAFAQAYQSNNGNYTAATIAALQSLRAVAGASGNSNQGNSGSVPVANSGGGLFSSVLGTTCCIGVIVLVGLGLLFVLVRRRSGSGQQARPQGIPPYNQPYQQPGYGPNYGQQRSSMNPFAAGGLGAAAGGVLGYLFGRESGGNASGNQGDFGGGSSSDFGGGGGDSGGGGGSSSNF